MYDKHSRFLSKILLQFEELSHEYALRDKSAYKMGGVYCTNYRIYSKSPGYKIYFNSVDMYSKHLSISTRKYLLNE